MQVNVRVLKNSTIQYSSADNAIIIDSDIQDHWNLQGKKFFEMNSKPLHSWAVGILLSW